MALHIGVNLTKQGNSWMMRIPAEIIKALDIDMAGTRFVGSVTKRRNGTVWITGELINAIGEKQPYHAVSLPD